MMFHKADLVDDCHSAVLLQYLKNVSQCGISFTRISNQVFKEVLGNHIPFHFQFSTLWLVPGQSWPQTQSTAIKHPLQ